MKIFDSFMQLVGNTPLLRVKGEGNIFAKLESFNPAGSAKDRVALSIIETAEREGVLTPQSVIIESTSGNTGIGLCAVAAAKGYKVIIVMPESMSEERKKMMSVYGAELVLTPAALGMKGANDKADELARELPNSFKADQFNNAANIAAHYNTTGPEIWRDTCGKVDIFVAGVGTGGTLTGVGRYLKEQNPNIKVYAVEPASSPLLSKGVAASHKIQGIGANFVPNILDKNIYDEVITVADDDAIATAKNFVKSDGMFVGISSGAALYAARLISGRSENKGKNIVVLLPDTGER
ncbi:MAG: cysteine synthase A, partial [Clostridia bacterium]|nr:cysteine synthase A [Clostridia bacterium]